MRQWQIGPGRIQDMISIVVMATDLYLFAAALLPPPGIGGSVMFLISLPSLAA
jgi:hypothetical protein